MAELDSGVTRDGNEWSYSDNGTYPYSMYVRGVRISSNNRAGLDGAAEIVRGLVYDVRNVVWEEEGFGERTGAALEAAHALADRTEARLVDEEGPSDGDRLGTLRLMAGSSALEVIGREEGAALKKEVGWRN